MRGQERLPGPVGGRCCSEPFGSLCNTRHAATATAAAAAAAAARCLWRSIHDHCGLAIPTCYAGYSAGPGQAMQQPASALGVSGCAAASCALAAPWVPAKVA